MATNDQIIEVNVRTDAAPVGRAGFGVALVADTGGTMTERVRFYSGASEAEIDANNGAITAAQLTHVRAAFAQSIRPASVAVGRISTTPVAQVVTVTVGGTPAEDDYTITEGDADYTYTGEAGDTNDDVAAGLRAALGAAPGVTVSGSGAEVILTANVAGVPFTVTTTAPAGATLVAVLTTPNVSLATELSALRAQTDSWYGLHLVSRTKANILAAAAWAESSNKMHVAQTSDADVLTASAGNVAAELAALSYNRTKIEFYSDNAAPAAFARLASFLAVDPDQSVTLWDNYTLAGIQPDVFAISTTARTNLITQRCGYYLTLGGVGATGGGGFMASGRYADVQLTVDWLTARLFEAHAQLMLDYAARGRRIPFTDAGFAAVASVAARVLDLAVRVGHIAELLNAQGDVVSPYVRLPRRVDVAEADVQARRLRYTAGGLLAGGVQQLVLNVDLTDDAAQLLTLAPAA